MLEPEVVDPELCRKTLHHQTRRLLLAWDLMLDEVRNPVLKNLGMVDKIVEDRQGSCDWCGSDLVKEIQQ